MDVASLPYPSHFGQFALWSRYNRRRQVVELLYTFFCFWVMYTLIFMRFYLKSQHVECLFSGHFSLVCLRWGRALRSLPYGKARAGPCVLPTYDAIQSASVSHPSQHGFCHIYCLSGSFHLPRNDCSYSYDSQWGRPSLPMRRLYKSYTTCKHFVPPTLLIIIYNHQICIQALLLSILRYA